MKTIILLLLAISLLQNDRVACAATSDFIEFSEQISWKYLKHARDFIRGSNNLDLINADKGVVLVLDNFIIPNAYIVKKAGSDLYEIHVSNRLALALMYTYEMNAITNKLTMEMDEGMNKKRIVRCAIKYREYIYKMFTKNAENSFYNKELEDLLPPEEFAFTCSDCEGIPNYFPMQGQKERIMRDASIDLSFLLIYLHELAHKELGHRMLSMDDYINASTEKEKEVTFLKYMKNSRIQEYEADSWAIAKAIELGISYPRIITCGVFTYLTAASGIYCASEMFETHPQGYSRLTNAVNEIELNIEQRNLPRYPEVQTLIRNIKLFDKKLRKTLNCDAIDN